MNFNQKKLMLPWQPTLVPDRRIDGHWTHKQRDLLLL